MSSSRTVRIGVIVLVLVFIVSALTWYRFSTLAEEVYSGPVDSIRIGNVGEYSIFNIIADKQGYFKDQGLDAKITEFTSGPASIAGLLEGAVDFNIAADFVGVRNIFTRPDIRILAEVNTHRVFQLVARPGGITSLEDIKGKRVGVTRNSAGEYFLGNYLNFNNIPLADVTLVNQTPAEMVQGLEEGTIDAIVVFEPHIYKIKKKFGDTVTLWDLQAHQTTNAVLYSTKGYLDAHPEVAIRYLRALVKAERYYMEHQADALMIVGTVLKLDPDYQEYAKTRLIHTIALNEELLINMESQAAWTIKNKLTNATEVPNFLHYIYSAALEAAKEESVTFIR